jgi:hypothetical protein
MEGDRFAVALLRAGIDATLAMQTAVAGESAA